MRADTLSGYVSAFEVNMAKKVGSVEKGSGVNVVKTLTKDIQNTFDISALTTFQVLISSLICTNSSVQLWNTENKPIGLPRSIEKNCQKGT